MAVWLYDQVRADIPAARQIEAALDGHVLLNLMGTDLPMLAGILAACRALVSNDTQLMQAWRSASHSGQVLRRPTGPSMRTVAPHAWQLVGMRV